MEETQSTKPPIGDDMIGRRIGQYEIVREIGRGGMATVYLARQSSMNRQVAVKVLPREFLHDPQFIERFKREVRLIAELEHPHILPVYDFGEFERIPFIVMRYLGGGSLRDVLNRGMSPLADLVRPVEQVCSALDFAHAEGIIHRDLKPSNIMLDERGNAYLSDFGIAQIMQDAGRLTGSAVIGTPAYMSPEQAEGRPLDARSDVYSMGVVLFELLTAREPFQADTPMAMLLKQITEPMPSPRLYRPDLSEGVEQVVLRATSKDPSSRYASAGEFAKAFRRAVSEAARQTGETPEVEMTYVPSGVGQAATRPAVEALTDAEEGYSPTLLGSTPAPATAAPARPKTPAPVVPQPAGGPVAVPAPEPRVRRRGGALIAALALVVVIVGGGALLLASGVLGPSPAPATGTPPPSATPGPTGTPAPATPFPNADTYRGPNNLYQLSIPGGWERESYTAGNELFVQWFPEDRTALVTLRLYNTGQGSADHFEAGVQQYREDYYSDPRYYTAIDHAPQGRDGVRYSYRVPQPGGLYGQFGPGQVDVFYNQYGPYFVVLEFFTADSADIDVLLPVLQNVLDSLWIDPSVTWGETGPLTRRAAS